MSSKSAAGIASDPGDVADSGAPADPVGGYYTHIRTDILPLLPERLGSVLEIGCGAGTTMAWLRSIRDVDYAAGVEMFPEAVTSARANFDEVELADVSHSTFDFSQKRFDVVLALDVLEHLPDPWAVLRSLRTKMQPDGRLIASIPNVANIAVAFPLLFRGTWNYTESGLLDKTHLRFFTRETVVKMMQDCGFSVETIVTTRGNMSLFSAFGLTGPRWRWYSYKILGLFMPARWLDFQFLISVRPSGPS
jgi:2-polyprenyl-3-methyl-5-hydroxy-6-metoxy-1,4-benzoquinol methylase